MEIDLIELENVLLKQGRGFAGWLKHFLVYIKTDLECEQQKKTYNTLGHQLLHRWFNSLIGRDCNHQ